MSTIIIDADAATLAGLQIDLLQKMRQGHITLDHIKWFNGLTKEDRDRYVVGEKPPMKSEIIVASSDKFGLLADLGIMTVPAGYDHATQLVKFGEKKSRKRFCSFNDEIMDENFPNPSRILKPGDKLRVRAFQQIVGGTTTSEERMAFLATQKAIHTGAQGASLVFEQMRDKLPKGKWYASFDEKERLWKDASGGHRVPGVDAYSDGVFGFSLGRFEEVWDQDYAFLCFCDVE